MAAGVTAGAGQPDNPLHLRPHHITASVSDLDRATAWYQRMLGFTVKSRGKHGDVAFVELAVAGFGIALIHAPTTAGSASERLDAPRWVHIVFTVPDTDATYHALLSKGAAVGTRENPTPNPVRSFLVKDSEGNEIEILGGSPP
jgi:catechol 2,3-dioxygenase-like lactoylglutathione lyase family enzyme